jgi:hypothetical protein
MRRCPTHRLLFLLTVVAATALPTSAQKDFKPPRRPLEVNAEGRAPLGSQLRLRALDLAASTADEALGWNDTRAAVRSLSQAADLLWADYPERSRGWLEKAWEIAGAVSDEDADPSVVRFRSTSPRSQARAAVLSVAQKHDRQLADRLVAQLDEDGEASGGAARRGAFDDQTVRSEQLLNTALAVAERDPASAAELARLSLADGVSFQLQSLLLTLRERDRVAAGRLFDSALDRLSLSFKHPSEAQVLASYLFTPGRVAGAGGGGTMLLAVGTGVPVPSKTPAEEEPARSRRFLRVMQRILLSQPSPAATADPPRTAQEFITLCGSLSAGYRLYAPELWPPVESRVAQAVLYLGPPKRDNRMPASAREKLASGLAAGADEKELGRLYVEGLVEAAEKDPDPVSRKFAFVRATLATKPRDFEYARKLADKIDEAELRGQVMSLLAYRAALLSVEAGDYEEAVQTVAEASPLHRAVILIAAARKMNEGRTTGNKEESRNRRSRARELLYAAGDILARDGLPAYALRVRLGLVAVLAPVDVERSFEVFGGTVGAINSDASFDPNEARLPRMTGLADYMDSAMPPAGDFFGLKNAVAPLAHADLEATIMTLSRLSTPAVRGACMLEIARSILSADSVK